MIYIKIRGGLGNQLFQYASSRSFAITTEDDLCLDLSGITNKTHNIYTLNKFNINATTTEECKIWQKKVAHIFSSISYRIGKKLGYNISYKFDLIVAPLLNLFGIYNVDNGYIKFKKALTKNKYIIGYLQSEQYFSDNQGTIKKELSPKQSLTKKNKVLSEEMKKCNSICIHIRRGDFVDVGAIVCSEKYYIEAAKYLNKKLKDAQFYIFSNDIDWVKENIKFPMKVNYIEGNNPSYEEIMLMSSCNNFIISNSTFSWWGQYLSNNNNKIVIAPNRWFVDGQKEDIYQQNWLILDKNGKLVKNNSKDRGIKC